MGVFYQFFGTLIISSLNINLALVNVWPSSTVNLFRSSYTTLNRPMTDNEIALFGCIMSAGSLIANLYTGLLLDNLGRKKSAILTSMAFVVAWTLISITNRVEVVLLAFFVAGLGGPAVLVSTVYVSEICQDSIRGAMTSLSTQITGLGIMVSYVLGGALEYNVTVYVYLTISVISVLFMTTLKDSPSYLMKKGFEEEAARSIGYYRNKKSYSEDVRQQVKNIRLQLNPYEEETTSLSENVTSKRITLQREAGLSSVWEFFRKSKSTQKQLVLCIILSTSIVVQGLPLVQVYAEPIFKEAVPKDVISATVCTIIMQGVSIVFGIAGAYMTDVIGRRPLIIYMSVATGLSCLALATQIQLDWGPKWFTALMMNVYTAVYSMGAGNVPFVIIGDLFTPQVKSIMSMICVEWGWLCTFLCLFIFTYIVTTFGLTPIFYFFAMTSFATSVYCSYFLPETKGFSVDAVQKLFLNIVS